MFHKGIQGNLKENLAVYQKSLEAVFHEPLQIIPVFISAFCLFLKEIEVSFWKLSFNYCLIFLIISVLLSKMGSI